MKRLLLLLLTLAMLFSISASAWGEGIFDVPLEVSIEGIHADQIDPLDEQRLGELNQLLGHIGVTLRTGEVYGTVWSGISVSVDAQPVGELWLGESESEVFLSLPGNETVYSADDLSVLDTLIGTDPIQVSEMMLPDVFLVDAEALVDAIFTERDGVEVTKESQTVRDTNEATYGRVESRRRIKDTTLLTESIVESCPEGALKRFFSQLTISEIKDCYVLCKKDGKAAKAAFNGTVTDRKGEAYQVTLEWKLRRGEKNAADRDHMTLSYQGDTDTGSLEFRLTRKSANEVTYDIYCWEKNGFSISKGKKDTIHIKQGDQDLLTGEISIKLSGSTQSTLSLQFDLQTVEGITGNIVWKLAGDQNFSGTAVVRQIDIASIGQPDFITAIPLSVDSAERSAITKECRDQFAAELIAHLVLLENQEENIYLRKDLSDEAWNEIIMAARELLGQTGGEEE